MGTGGGSVGVVQKLWEARDRGLGLPHGRLEQLADAWRACPS